MNNESGNSLVAVMASLLLSSLLLADINKSLILAIKQTKFLKEKESRGKAIVSDCGEITKEELTWKCQSIDGKKRIIIYED